MQHNTFSRMGQAARYYAKKFNFHVFPVSPRGKSPLTTNGHLNASDDPLVISSMWAQHPNANIGIALKPSNLLVLDLDSKDHIDAIDSLADLESEFGPLPETPHAFTPRKGLHFYFKYEGTPFRKIGFKPGCDCLADGFIIAAPSVGQNGSTYEWEVAHKPTAIEIASAPQWLAQLGTLENDGGAKKSSNYWDTLLSNPIKEGTRNQAMTQIIGHLFRRFVDPALVTHIAFNLNRTVFAPSLSKEELKATIESVAGRELARRSKVA